MVLEQSLSLADAEHSSWHALGYSVGLAIAALASAYSAWHSKKASRTGETINDAVNHRHEKAGPHAPKLYDAVIALHETAEHLHKKTDTIDAKADRLVKWQEGYLGGPLDHGDKVVAFVESVDDLKTQVQKLEHHCKKKDCSDGCDE